MKEMKANGEIYSDIYKNKTATKIKLLIILWTPVLIL